MPAPGLLGHQAEHGSIVVDAGEPQHRGGDAVGESIRVGRLGIPLRLYPAKDPRIELIQHLASRRH